MHVSPGLGTTVPAHRLAMHEFSFGSVIENMSLWAASRGNGCILRMEGDWREHGRIATLAFSSGDPATLYDPLVRFLFTRHTNRRLYERRSADPAVLTALATAAGRYSDARTLWLDQPRVRRAALRLMRIAEGERFRRRELHAELFSAVRFDVGWNDSAEEGLPPGALEVERLARLGFQWLRHWPLQRAINVVGAAALLGLRAGWLPASKAAHLGILTVADDAATPWLTAGRAFQRLWLAATSHGLALQPMAAAVALAGQEATGEWVRSRIQARLREGLARLAGSGRPAMVFRVGYARPPSVTAGRRPVQSYLTSSPSEL